MRSPCIQVAVDGRVVDDADYESVVHFHREAGNVVRATNRVMKYQRLDASVDRSVPDFDVAVGVFDYSWRLQSLGGPNVGEVT
eukprot:scaffold53_cov193-Pinguiococcus_pyrenoidosus.AAC.16